MCSSIAYAGLDLNGTYRVGEWAATRYKHYSFASSRKCFKAACKFWRVV